MRLPSYSPVLAILLWTAVGNAAEAPPGLLTGAARTIGRFVDRLKLPLTESGLRGEATSCQKYNRELSSLIYRHVRAADVDLEIRTRRSMVGTAEILDNELESCGDAECREMRLWVDCLRDSIEYMNTLVANSRSRVSASSVKELPPERVEAPVAPGAAAAK